MQLCRQGNFVDLRFTGNALELRFVAISESKSGFTVLETALGLPARIEFRYAPREPSRVNPATAGPKYEIHLVLVERPPGNPGVARRDSSRLDRSGAGSRGR